MNNLTKAVLCGVATFIVFLGVYLVGVNGRLEAPTYSSVVQGGEYTSTTTATMGNNKLQNIMTVQGTLGSIVIASTTSLGSITLFDATSTTDVASTSIITFPPSTPAGTYTLDRSLQRGLGILISSGFNGGYTITYRQQ